MKIQENILNILAECKIEGNILFLPPEQLDRNTYVAVNKCLENIGGKWNQKEKGHIFDYDPTEAFDNLLLTGETEDMKKTFQFFPTPRKVAEIVCDMAELSTAQNILEPSCGKGDLADVIYERNQSLICVEINEDMKKLLDEKAYGDVVVYTDFLKFESDEAKSFNRIVMNPPFSKQQDIDHILHAYNILQVGGVLVSVMSVSPFFRTNKKSVEFRQWLEQNNAEIVDVKAGEFKESGTLIPTKIIKVVKS
ncbi:MAG: methyltransferase [Oscillospiraceae bacterium]|nr:methyltransferase [Oscillospiraceae bacterium]